MAEEKAQVIEMPAPSAGRPKTVRCEQKAIDALPAGSSDWVVEGVAGLIVRCGATEKTFRVQRRINKRLVRRVLGPLTVAAAKREALKVWAKLKPPPVTGKITLTEAWETYLAERPLSEKTQCLYRENLRRYLSDWAERPIEALGADRAGFRARFLAIARDHGAAVASQTLRCFRAVYNYRRAIHPDLPECPTGVVNLPTIRPRDWALCGL